MRVHRTDVYFIADGLEEPGNHILKRQAGVMVVGLVIVALGVSWLDLG